MSKEVFEHEMARLEVLLEVKPVRGDQTVGAVPGKLAILLYARIAALQSPFLRGHLKSDKCLRNA
jgi:hypothetical protein